MSSPLPWFTFTGPGSRRWRVGLSCEEDSPDLTDAHGWTYFDTGAVLIDTEQSRHEQDVIALHEMLHVAHETDDPAEERIVTRLAPRLLPILQQFGFRLPRRPRGVAALERRARGVDSEEEEE